MYKLKDWREAKEQYIDNLKNVKCFKLFEFLTFFYKIKNDQNDQWKTCIGNCIFPYNITKF